MSMGRSALGCASCFGSDDRRAAGFIGQGLDRRAGAFGGDAQGIIGGEMQPLHPAAEVVEEHQHAVRAGGELLTLLLFQ
jgi:hypothetical protein